MNLSKLPSGIATGIGSLPHRYADEGVAFALRASALPCIPSLPKRSPAESMVAQALVGITGITLGQYGTIAVDLDAFDPGLAVVTDLEHDAFVGFRSFLAAAGEHRGPVKWQFVGPVTLGLALIRAGVPVSMAFEVAMHAVRGHVAHLLDVVGITMPQSAQVVFIDEPSIGELLDPSFPIAPDAAIDLISAALAMIEPVATCGVHACGDADVASLVAAGPAILSLPVSLGLVDHAGPLSRFLDNGGAIAWGVVPTGGPITTSAERPWRQLSELWCHLVERGADPAKLRRQSIVTPECGLGMHTPAVAERVYRITAEVGLRVHDQASASRFALGA